MTLGFVYCHCKTEFYWKLNTSKLNLKIVEVNSIFSKNIFSPLRHPVKISASITLFFVREVTQSLVALHNLGEFKFLNNIIETLTFNNILWGGISDGVLFKNFIGICITKIITNKIKLWTLCDTYYVSTYIFSITLWTKIEKILKNVVIKLK